jgi:hypothetical protein
MIGPLSELTAFPTSVSTGFPTGSDRSLATAPAKKEAVLLQWCTRFSIEKECTMRRFNSLVVIGLLLGAMPAAQAQQTSDIERVHAASRQFVATIVARDINTMDAVWAHGSYASFIGPLSTTVVVGWDGVRQAWQMRFGQFDHFDGQTAHSH